MSPLLFALPALTLGGLMAGFMCRPKTLASDVTAVLGLLVCVIAGGSVLFVDGRLGLGLFLGLGILGGVGLSDLVRGHRVRPRRARPQPTPLVAQPLFQSPLQVESWRRDEAA